MKKLLSTLILLQVLLITHAQKATIEYGFQAGVNISTAYGDGVDKQSQSPLTGLHLGGHLKIKKTEHWGYTFLLSYDQIGWKYESLVFESTTGNGLVNADVLFKLNYLNLPVLVSYSFGKKVKVHVDGGVFVGVLLNNKLIQQPIPPSEEPRTEVSSTYRRTMNYGLSLGSGVQMPIAKKLKLDVDVRNNLGLANIYKAQGQGSDASSIKTNNFTVSAGLTFEL
jgi:opacity protein-like surface antigen